MDGVNELDENGMISNLLDPDTEKQTFGRKSQNLLNSGTKITFGRKSQNLPNLGQKWHFTLKLIRYLQKACQMVLIEPEEQ
ncbi:hypothetical protein Hanom_Chr10g00934831 [Helianthus anomalus]